MQHGEHREESDAYVPAPRELRAVRALYHLQPDHERQCYESSPHKEHQSDRHHRLRGFPQANEEQDACTLERRFKGTVQQEHDHACVHVPAREGREEERHGEDVMQRHFVPAAGVVGGGEKDALCGVKRDGKRVDLYGTRE